MMTEGANVFMCRIARDYGKMLLNLAYSRLGSREDAEDCVQEVFVTLLDKQPVFRNPTHEKAWLIRATINRAANLRKKTAGRFLPLEDNIPAPSDVQNEKHIQVIDSVSDPHVNIADIESKINMYQLFQQLPVLLNNEEDIAPDPELRKLEAGQRHSGIALLTYQFDKYNTTTHETETVGHALVVYGKPIATNNGFKVKVYDCRKDDECWIEVNTRANKWTGYVTGTDFSEYIKNCRYRNDFEVFNNYLDFDGAANSLNTPGASLSMQNDSAVEIADSLSGKTILQVTTNDIFQISNEEGQSFTFEDGTPIGNMPVYGVDFIVDGMNPSPLVFLVDDSSSFTCTAIGENAEIRAFAVIGGGASGEAQVEKSEGSSWKSVRIDDIGEIHTVGSSSQ